MIVQPKIRGFICTTAHPVGCEKNVLEQIEYVKGQPVIKNGPKKVLVIGASTGYGLASKITAAFSCGAATMGVFFERESDNKRTATAGWYNSQAFDKFARQAGLYTKSFNGDAFSNEIRQKVIAALKEDWGQADLVVYSLASPRRTDPKTGITYKSALKPIGASYTGKTIDFEKNEVSSLTLPPASEDEIQQTKAVMGGEDWQLWIDELISQDALADGCITVAYSYVGPEITRHVYRNGTIGAAKDHLEATAKSLHDKLKKYKGQAFVSVNKAIVTQSSSAIPFIPLYFIILAKVMKEKNVHENSIQQIYRLFASKLYSGKPVEVDESGLIRLDDLELRDDVQEEVLRRWELVSNSNVSDVADVTGYHEDFMRLFGFGIKNVDYHADVEI